MSDQRPPRNHLREWRRLTGLNQRQVERYFKWGKSRVSHLENSRALLTDEVLTSLAGLYKCAPGDLLSPPPGWRRRAIERGASEPPETTALPDTITMLRALKDEVRAFKARLDAASRHA